VSILLKFPFNFVNESGVLASASDIPFVEFCFGLTLFSLGQSFRSFYGIKNRDIGTCFSENFGEC
jgi:hypothetical protein